MKKKKKKKEKEKEKESSRCQRKCLAKENENAQTGLLEDRGLWSNDRESIFILFLSS
jgi:hypothetical protein